MSQGLGIYKYCLVVEASFYSDNVECLPVASASWVQFPAGAGKILSLYKLLYNNYKQCRS